MGTASLSIGRSANEVGERSCTTKCTDVRTKKMTAEIIRLAADFLGSRKRIAYAAGCCIRTISNWKSGDRTVAFEEFFNLLDEPRGVEYFEVLWRQVPEQVRDRFLERQILERELREAEEKIKRVRRQSEDLQIHMDLKR